MVTRGLGNHMSTRSKDGRGGGKVDPLFRREAINVFEESDVREGP
jgi:hypothetical protein